MIYSFFQQKELPDFRKKSNYSISVGSSDGFPLPRE
jgi:hypothetical protein